MMYGDKENQPTGAEHCEYEVCKHVNQKALAKV
jgi:hypothetical protein